jgi:hypothetical protein
MVILIGGLLLLLIVLVQFFEPSTPSRRASATAQKTMNVRVAWNDLALQVTNVDTTAGGEMIVYINGTPPFTYRATTQVPAAGESVQIPLRGFVTKSGDRFNPMTQAVTVAWVGGGGFDYRQYGK